MIFLHPLTGWNARVLYVRRFQIHLTRLQVSVPSCILKLSGSLLAGISTSLQDLGHLDWKQTSPDTKL